MNSSIPHKAARDEGLGCYKLRVRLLKLNETLPNFNRTRNEHNKKSLQSLRELTHGLYFVQIDPALGLTMFNKRFMALITFTFNRSPLGQEYESSHTFG